MSTLRRAGPTAQLLNIVRHLDRRNFDPLVITLSSEPADSMMDSFTRIGARVRSLSMSRPRAALHRGWRRDIERLADARLDGSCVVHSQGIRGDVISSGHLAGVLRVSTARNYPYDDYVMKFGRLPGLWLARTHLRAFRSLPLVVACSSTLSEMLRKHGIATTVIRNGVDTTMFQAASVADKERLRSELGLAAAVRVGVCVGALSERKNTLRVVQAVRVIDDPDFAMVFVGSGSLANLCRREARGDTRIRFVGQVEDVARYLRAADFFVSASCSEGLPNSALEAIACGVRLVLSDIGPHRELLEMAPSMCELFATGEQAALVSAIRRAAARSAGGAVLDGVAEDVGAERMSQRYQELYLSLADTHGRTVCG